MSAIGSAGDVHPMVGIGARLVERGHRVAMFTNPYFADLVTRFGIECIPLGSVDDYHTAIADADLWHPTRALGVIAEHAILKAIPDVYHTIAERYVPGETVVTAHALDLGSRIAQDKFNCPVASLHIAPVMFRSVHVPPVLPIGLSSRWAPGLLLRTQWWFADRYFVDPLLALGVNAFRAEVGLPPVTRIMDQWWHSPDLVLGLFPDWYAPRQPDWPPQAINTGFPLFDEGTITEIPDDVADFITRGTPPIVFTPGSANVHAREFFSAAVDACDRLNARGMLLTRHAEQIPVDLPPEVRHFDYVPLSYVLPRSAALVHHGGIGTTAQGLKAGVPQLVMALAHDQFDNAARLRRLGVGERIPVRKFSSRRVAHRLTALITSPSVALACRACAARFAGVDGVAAACDQIESLAERWRKVCKP